MSTSLSDLISMNYTGDADGRTSMIPTIISPAVRNPQLGEVVASTPSPSSTPSLSLASVADDESRKLTKEEALELQHIEREYKEALTYVKDIIAPPMMRIDSTKLQI